MKNFLEEILIDPFSSKALLNDESKMILHTEDYKSIYTVLEDVPVILPASIHLNVETNLHKSFETGFNYPAHYQKDAEVYNYFKEEENISTKNEIRRLHEAIITAVPKEAKLILDVGCGNAWVANYFLKKNRQVISMDISSVNPVRALRENPDKNHAALVADVFHLPLKNNSIDCIVASEIMEHVYEPGLFIDKLVEKLKPGGKLIITTPYNEKIEYYLCVHCNLPTPKNAHLHSFNKQNIRKILSGKPAKWKAKSFSNKYMTKIKLYTMISFLPFGIWIIIDRIINGIFYKPGRLLIELNKIQ